MRILAVLSFFILISGCQDEYQKTGSKYQCFIDGEQIYKSNSRPEHRGDNWYILDGEKVQVDACFCMGCLSI